MPDFQTCVQPFAGKLMEFNVCSFVYNSRLFFTMDPKLGEISRAMRNRGIEIYIPGEVGEVSGYLLLWKLTL